MQEWKDHIITGAISEKAAETVELRGDQQKALFRTVGCLVVS